MGAGHWRPCRRAKASYDFIHSLNQNLCVSCRDSASRSVLFHRIVDAGRPLSGLSPSVFCLAIRIRSVNSYRYQVNHTRVPSSEELPDGCSRVLKRLWEAKVLGVLFFEATETEMEYLGLS